MEKGEQPRVLSGFVASVTESIRKLALPLQKTTLFGVVLDLKQFLNKAVFKCPERHYKLYSLLFIIVPAVGFLCLALMISRSFWRFVAGCSCFSKRHRGIVWRHSRKFVYLCILPPFTWLFLVFVDTEYYVCSKLGPLEARLNQEQVIPGLKTAYSPAEPAIDIVAEFQSAETESQIIAFLLLSVMLLIGAIAISLDRCCTKSDSSIKNDEDYVYNLAEEQIKLFNSRIEQLAKEEAQVQVQAVLDEFESVTDNSEKIRLVSEIIAEGFPWARGKHYRSYVPQ